MELLVLIAGITACVFLVQSIKAKRLISQLRIELAARHNDLKGTEGGGGVASLRSGQYAAFPVFDALLTNRTL